MKIDVLSQNTLKLTLSKLDMFDLDIKYESLSGKNPETKRLLSHVMRCIQSDKQVSFDFSGERLFIEAFPRIDGGCMLYISCLEEDTHGGKKSRRSVPPQKTELFLNNLPAMKPDDRRSKKDVRLYICELCDFHALGSLCKSLFIQKNNIKSSLYAKDGIYRLIIGGGSDICLKGLLSEFGTVLDFNDSFACTEEYFKLIAEDNAVKVINDCF